MSVSRDKIQVTFFEFEIVDCEPAQVKEGWLCNTTKDKRLLVRESYIIVDRDRKTQDYSLKVPTSKELTYTIIGTEDGVKIGDDDTLTFTGAGLRCMSKAIGPAFQGKGNTVLEPVSVLTELDSLAKANVGNATASANNSAGRRLMQNFPRSFAWIGDPGLAENLFSLLEEVRQKLPKAVPTWVVASQSMDKQVWNLYVTAMGGPHSGTVTVDGFDPNLLKSAGLLNNDLYEPIDKSKETVAPIFWYPLKQEAFAAGSIAFNDGFRVFGRLGAHTQGYRVGRTTYPFPVGGRRYIYELGRSCHSNSPIEECDYRRYAEIALNIKLVKNSPVKMELNNGVGIELFSLPVPFYVGAMPIADPVGVAIVDGQPNIDESQMTYLTGTLKLPIVFDPQVNCPPC